MKKSVLFLLFILFSFVSVGTANALSVSVLDNVPDDQYLWTGTSISGQFDLNPVIPTDGQYIIPYDVEGAASTFTFTDDGELNFMYSTHSSYSYHHTSGSNQYYTRIEYEYFMNQDEVVQVNVAGQISIDGTNYYSMQTYNGQEFDYSQFLGLGRYRLFYTLEYDRIYGNGGSITLTQVFDNDSLSDLSEDGIVEFTITPLYGDIIFNSGILEAEINPNPNAVPIPGAIYLLGSGLVGLIGYRKKFKS